MDNYYTLSDDVRDNFVGIYKEKAFPINIGFCFLGNDKQKQMIKVTKLADQYQFLLDKEMLITINEKMYDNFDEKSIIILIEQELDKININAETGKITMVKPDLVTFSPLISKYGYDAVSKANQVETLAFEQKEDMEETFNN